MKGFEQFHLLPPILQALQDAGYDQPTPVQQEALPAALDGRDVFASAQTGTGKTAAFVLPILQRLAAGEFSPVARRPLALVVVPTRELAVQVAGCCEDYGRHLSISHVLVHGGVGQSKQVEAIERGVHIVVATPGRLLDLMRQSHVFLNRLLIFAVDEADRMLDMGFLPDLKAIVRDLPIRRQNLFFSATLPDAVHELAEKLLHQPVRLQISEDVTNPQLIDQRVIHASYGQKKPLLVQLLSDGTVARAIVFTRTRRAAEAVAEYLRRSEIAAAALHGNLSQTRRRQAMIAFCSDKVNVLVATDLAARGLDIENVSHIINFDVPREPEQYVHRIGRTGRAGMSGIAITLCAADERRLLNAIERFADIEILADGRTPSPEMTTEEVTETTSGERSGLNRRRRRRRRAGSKPNAGPANAPAVDAAATTGRRPTAAERKAARNRRRRKKTDNSD